MAPARLAYATFLTVVSVAVSTSHGVAGTEERNIAVKKFIKLLKDVSGASAAEYALILAIVGAAIALAAFNLGGAIDNAMDGARECIENPETGTC